MPKGIELPDISRRVVTGRTLQTAEANISELGEKSTEKRMDTFETLKPLPSPTSHPLSTTEPSLPLTKRYSDTFEYKAMEKFRELQRYPNLSNNSQPPSSNPARAIRRSISQSPPIRMRITKVRQGGRGLMLNSSLPSGKLTTTLPPGQNASPPNTELSHKPHSKIEKRPVGSHQRSPEKRVSSDQSHNEERLHHSSANGKRVQIISTLPKRPTKLVESNFVHCPNISNLKSAEATKSPSNIQRTSQGRRPCPAQPGSQSSANAHMKNYPKQPFVPLQPQQIQDSYIMSVITKEIRNSSSFRASVPATRKRSKIHQKGRPKVQLQIIKEQEEESEIGNKDCEFHTAPSSLSPSIHDSEETTSQHKSMHENYSSEMPISCSTLTQDGVVPNLPSNTSQIMPGKEVFGHSSKNSGENTDFSIASGAFNGDGKCVTNSKENSQAQVSQSGSTTVESTEHGWVSEEIPFLVQRFKAQLANIVSKAKGKNSEARKRPTSDTKDLVKASNQTSLFASPTGSRTTCVQTMSKGTDCWKDSRSPEGTPSSPQTYESLGLPPLQRSSSSINHFPLVVEAISNKEKCRRKASRIPTNKVRAAAPKKGGEISQSLICDGPLDGPQEKSKACCFGVEARNSPARCPGARNNHDKDETQSTPTFTTNQMTESQERPIRQVISKRKR